MFQSSDCVLYDRLKKRKKGHKSPFLLTICITSKNSLTYAEVFENRAQYLVGGHCTACDFG